MHILRVTRPICGDYVVSSRIHKRASNCSRRHVMCTVLHPTMPINHSRKRSIEFSNFGQFIDISQREPVCERFVDSMENIKMMIKMFSLLIALVVLRENKFHISANLFSTARLIFHPNITIDETSCNDSSDCNEENHWKPVEKHSDN